MKTSHFVLTAFLLRFTSVSSLGLRAGGKTEIAGERILANDVVSPDLLSIPASSSILSYIVSFNIIGITRVLECW
jgi:hypothetical protein